jgi:hypothetical protein
VAVFKSQHSHAHTVPCPAAGVHDGPEESPILATPQSRAIRPAPAPRGVVEGARREGRVTAHRREVRSKKVPGGGAAGLSLGERPKLTPLWRRPCQDSRPRKPKGEGLTGASQFLTIPGTLALCNAQNRTRAMQPSRLAQGVGESGLRASQAGIPRPGRRWRKVRRTAVRDVTP